MLSIVFLQCGRYVRLLDQFLGVHGNQFCPAVVHHPDQVHRAGLALEYYVLLVVKLPFVHNLLVVLVNIDLRWFLLFDVFSSNISVVL